VHRRVLLILVAALAAAGCADSGPRTDRADTLRMFLETCAPGGDPEERSVCRCAFDRLGDDLSDEELGDIDRSVRGEPEELPAEVVEAALACAAEPLTPPTPPQVTTTTVDPDEETTTTTTAEDEDDGEP
jgi:hypothetical protein